MQKTQHVYSEAFTAKKQAHQIARNSTPTTYIVHVQNAIHVVAAEDVKLKDSNDIKRQFTGKSCTGRQLLGVAKSRGI